MRLSFDHLPEWHDNEGKDRSRERDHRPRRRQ